MEEEVKIWEQEPENQIDPSTWEIIENPQVDDFTDASNTQLEWTENSPLIEEVNNDVKLNEAVEEEQPKYLVTIKKADQSVEQKPVAKLEEKIDEKIEEEVWDLFVNYDSEFHKNQKSILQKIRAFKMTPKTSITFVLILIVITVWWIWIMMKIDPENHNLENYKTNVLSLLWKKPKEVVSSWSLSTNTWSNNTDTWVVNNSSWTVMDWTWSTQSWLTEEKEEILIREKWLTISPDIIKNEDWSISYLYNWKVYTKDELQEQLRIEVKIEEKRKTKDYLNKVYIEH